MKYSIVYLPFLVLSISSCIGDDFVSDAVDPVLQINNAIDTLAEGESHQFTSRFLNNVGLEESIDATWTSSDPSLVNISESGLAEGLQSGGSAIITASVTYQGNTFTSSTDLNIGMNTVVVEPTIRSGVIASTSSYVLTGDFTLSETTGGLLLDIADNYRASSSLPGLYVYLTNNPATINGALEIGRVTTFNGAHNYTIPTDADLNEYGYVLYFCKPFTVKVGDGLISQ